MTSIIQESGTENYEEREVRTKSAKTDMNQDEVDKLVDDCKRGFSRIAEANVLETAMALDKTSLAANTLSAPRPKDILVRVAQEVAVDTPSQPTVEGSRPSPSGSPSSDKGRSERMVLVDIAKVQRDAEKSLKKTVTEEKNKFWKELHAASLVLNKASLHNFFSGGQGNRDYELVKDRVYVALGFMEHKYKNKAESKEPDYSINKDRMRTDYGCWNLILFSSTS